MPDFTPGLHLLAVATNAAGELLDVTTGQRLQLAPATHFHLLLTDPAQVQPLAPPKSFEPIRRLVIPKDQALYFKLNQTEWGTLTVVVRMLEDVWMIQEQANKLPELEKHQHCEVQGVKASPTVFQLQPPFAPFQADSLNQAYFLASKSYEPKRASHAGSVHQQMRTGHLDFLLREVWDILDKQPNFWDGVKPSK